jgi:hypothetical protein
MTDSFYTHELWYRSTINETDEEWTRAEDEDGEWNEDQTGLTVTKIHPLRARVEVDGQSVTFTLEAKVTFHDECEYQFRPITPG